MLVIRTQQLDLLEHVPRTAFERSLSRHFAQFYPHECARLGPEQMRKLIQLGIKKGSGYGYTSRTEVGFYCNLMLMLGSDFDRDPQIPWAAEQIDNMSIAAPEERIRALFNTAIKYLTDSFGRNAEYMARALVRIRDYDLNAAPAGADLENDLLHLFDRFCPQKLKAQGEGPTRELIRLGVVEAGRHGIASAQGLTVYTALMYMIGSGFDRDPVYPWAEAILQGAVGDEREKVNRLHEAAIVYVNQVLAE